MHVALNERLAALPDDTVTYVGHEYTASNGAFFSSRSKRTPLIFANSQSPSPSLWILRTPTS